jgi:hypothetical protein
MKLKAIAAAIALLAGGQAVAAPISDDAMGIGQAGILGGTGAGNWFLTVVDTVRQQGFVLNLGRNVLADVGSPADFTVTNSALGSFIAGGSLANMYWNVGGLSNFDADAAEPFESIGFLTTNSQQSRTDFLADGLTPVFGTTGNTSDFINAVNSTGLLNSSDGAIIASASGFAYPGSNAWNNSNGGALSFDNSSAIGASTFVNFVFSPGLGLSDPNIPEANKLLGSASLAANGTFTFTAVPVPAAVWLLGSALLGMAGVSRRRS